jgi:nitric oxide reductase large subunit
VAQNIEMRFAKIVFTGAGIWGFVILTPLLFLYDSIGQQYPPPMTHPDMFFGFVTVALAWQAAFLIIGRDPVRFRPLMIAAMIEKFAYVIALAVLHAQGRIQFGQAAVGFPDLILGSLFVAAFVKTG